MAAHLELKLEVDLAWWFRLYVAGLLFTVFLTGLEADWLKVDRVIRRAIRIRVK